MRTVKPHRSAASAAAHPPAPPPTTTTSALSSRATEMHHRSRHIHLRPPTKPSRKGSRAPRIVTETGSTDAPLDRAVVEWLKGAGDGLVSAFAACFLGRDGDFKGVICMLR